MTEQQAVDAAYFVLPDLTDLLGTTSVNRIASQIRQGQYQYPIGDITSDMGMGLLTPSPEDFANLKLFVRHLYTAFTLVHTGTELQDITDSMREYGFL